MIAKEQPHYALLRSLFAVITSMAHLTRTSQQKSTLFYQALELPKKQRTSSQIAEPVEPVPKSTDVSSRVFTHGLCLAPVARLRETTDESYSMDRLARLNCGAGACVCIFAASTKVGAALT